MSEATVKHVVAARSGLAIRVEAGAEVEVIDLSGGQIVDTWAFNASDVREFHSAEHTRVEVDGLFPAIGERFVTNRRRPILQLVADHSPGIHDLLIAACDPSRYEQLGVEGWHASCQENLLSKMAAAGFNEIAVPQPINLFMNTPADAAGRIQWLPTETLPGDSVILRATMDLWFVVSACPQDITGINRTPGPIEVRVRPAPTAVQQRQ